MSSVIDMLPTKRQCDGCDLCCTAVGVYEPPDFNKAPGVRCKHLSGPPGKSCAIYKGRPGCCDAYACFWRASDTLIPKEFFPADCGFVISLSHGPLQGTTNANEPMLITVTCDPARPDAWKTPEAKAIFKALAKEFNAAVVVGEAHQALYLFAPRGAEYSRFLFPYLFTDERVGLHADDFFPHRLTQDEVARKLFLRNGVGLLPFEQNQKTKVHAVEPHYYSPSVLHIGDCDVCGHLEESPLHKK